MPELTRFTVVRTINPEPPGNVRAKAVFRAQIDRHSTVLADIDEETIELLIRPVEARIENGQLCKGGNPGVELLSSEGLVLDGALQYLATFSSATVDGAPITLAPLLFAALPGEGSFDLRDAAPLTSSTATPVARGSTGPEGPTGASGASGASGGTGGVGATGASGASGGTGGVGATGATGASGATGATGVSDVAAVTHAAAAKASLVDADEFPVIDGATGASGAPATWGLKRSTFAVLKAAILSYISTAIADFSNKTLTAPTIVNPTVTVGPSGTPLIQRKTQAATGPVMLGASGAVDCVTVARFDEAVALLHLDGASGSTTITDSGRLAANWTALGTAAISTAQSVSGGASLATNTTSGIRAPNADMFAFGTLGFTVGMWVYVTSLPGGSFTLLDGRPTGGVNGAYLDLYCTSSGEPRLWVNSADRIISGVTLATGTWHHIALCRSGTSTRLFINGVQAGATWTDTTDYLPTDGTFGVIGNNKGLNGGFSGHIDSVRVLAGHADYTTTFTPPTRHGDRFEDASTAVGTVALLHCNGASGSTTITDSGVLQSNWTASGNAQVSTAQSKFGGASLYFDGTGDYLTPTADPSNFAFGSGDFCIEMWCRPETIAGANRVIFDARPQSGNGAYPSLYIDSATGALYYYAASVNRITGPVLSVDTWYHIAVSRSGTATKLWVDGVQQGSTWTDTTVYVASAARPRIGANAYSNDANNFIGWMDDIRVTKGVARYTDTFTPPAAPHPDPPSIRLPGASGHTVQHTVLNEGSESVLLVPAPATPAQEIDGATAPLTLATDQRWTGIPDPAGTGWRKVA